MLQSRGRRPRFPACVVKAPQHMCKENNEPCIWWLIVSWRRTGLGKQMNFLYQIGYSKKRMDIHIYIIYCMLLYEYLSDWLPGYPKRKDNVCLVPKIAKHVVLCVLQFWFTPGIWMASHIIWSCRTWTCGHSVMLGLLRERLESREHSGSTAGAQSRPSGHWEFGWVTSNGNLDMFMF